MSEESKYLLSELIEIFQERYSVFLQVFKRENDIYNFGIIEGYQDILNLLNEKKLANFVNFEYWEIFRHLIKIFQQKYNNSLESKLLESEEEKSFRLGKTFAYYDILDVIDVQLSLGNFSRRLFNVITPVLNTKIDDTIIKPLPTRKELIEKLLLLLDNKMSKEDIDAWARHWVVANSEAGKIEDGIAWEILHNLQFIKYSEDDTTLKDDLKEWLKELEVESSGK